MQIRCNRKPQKHLNTSPTWFEVFFIQIEGKYGLGARCRKIGITGPARNFALVTGICCMFLIQWNYIQTGSPGSCSVKNCWHMQSMAMLEKTLHGECSGSNWGKLPSSWALPPSHITIGLTNIAKFLILFSGPQTPAPCNWVRPAGASNFHQELRKIIEWRML